jgi:hypothetical protein
MKSNRFFLFAIGGMLILAAAVLMTTGQVAADEDRCEVQGSWVADFDGGPGSTGLLFQETITPLDPNGKRLAYTMRLVNPYAAAFHPEADFISPLIGEAVRTSSNTYNIHLIGYGMQEIEGDRGQIRYIWTVSGELTCLDENHKTDNVYARIYSEDMDADKDGFPDEGMVPYLELGPLTLAEATRVHP